LLTIHTYRNGGALGNAMNSDQGLEPGDIIRLSDASGTTVCYRYREALKVMIKDYYDAPPDILYDNTGDPEVAIIICWDFNKTTKLWDSRIIYYADPIEA
ncbi:MAG TPA: class F sortase, partial [Propionibacteriaceae bacterium]|nr:class F sortase [Propionibacteriaceae bacterium]